MHPDLLRKLVGLVGAGHVLGGIDCSPFVLEGRTPDAVVLPGTRDEVAAVLALASEHEIPVTPWGGGTQIAVGAPPAGRGLVLALGRLTRVVEHEPGDLTATVEAGLAVAAFQRALAERGQWLSLDPPHAEQATVGGVLASNASGPRRHLYGTARDMVLGLTVVLADGTVVRGGGKVVKNVAGYDLPKLFVGSFGTLGVVVEVTVKLRPRPDADRLCVLTFETVEAAAAAARVLMSADLVPCAVDLVDGVALAALEPGARVAAALLVGVDGVAEQVDWQCAEMTRLAGPGAARVLDGAERDEAWRRRGEIARRVFPDGAAAMRWGVLPGQMGDLITRARDAARAAGLAAAFAGHAGVGVVTAVLSGGGGDAARVARVLEGWRGLVRAGGGHALLEGAPLAVKERVAVWDEPGPAQRIMARIKAELDPRGILNPGRFVGGI